MIRTIWTLAHLLSVFDPHIRSRHAELLDAIDVGVRTSPTLRRLVDRLAASDVIVYLELRRSPSPFVAAHLSFISAAGGRRYVHVAVDPKYAGCQLIALLGHELQHAAEIADEPSVVDERSLAAYYRRIGFAAGDGEERFDSQAAIDAGRRVMRETSGRLERAVPPVPLSSPKVPERGKPRS
jgi:hypothetical protein